MGYSMQVNAWIDGNQLQRACMQTERAAEMDSKKGVWRVTKQVSTPTTHDAEATRR